MPTGCLFSASEVELQAASSLGTLINQPSIESAARKVGWFISETLLGFFLPAGGQEGCLWDIKCAQKRPLAAPKSAFQTSAESGKVMKYSIFPRLRRASAYSTTLRGRCAHQARIYWRVLDHFSSLRSGVDGAHELVWFDNNRVCAEFSLKCRARKSRPPTPITVRWVI